MAGKYNKKQREELLSYLSYAVKEGYCDETFATEATRNKAWGLIDEMRGKAEFTANSYEKTNT